jgi:hypothetical protein
VTSSAALLRCLFFAAALAFLPLRGVLADDPPANDKPPATEIRTYNVSDLIHEIPNYGARTEQVDPPPVVGGGGSPPGPAQPKTVAERTEAVIKTILSLVAPESWRDSGGTFNRL